MPTKYRGFFWGLATSAILSITLVGFGYLVKNNASTTQDYISPTTTSTRDIRLSENVSPENIAVIEPAQVLSTGKNTPTEIASQSLLNGLGSDEIVAAHEQVLSRVYNKSLPSVVRIEIDTSVDSTQFRSESIPPQLRRFFQPEQQAPGLVPRGQGSGFVWSAEGHLITNYHVIAKADRITVIFSDGLEYEASILGSDPDADIAVLKIDAGNKVLKPLVLGDSSTVQVGQFAIAIGAPFGQDFTMTKGIISAIGRTIPSVETPFSNPEIIQTDAPINPGNSGGPLLDRHGHTIGINSQIASRSGSSSGVGFSVPINTAKRVVPELIKHGKYRYSFLGITGGDLTARIAQANQLDRNTRGIIVATVVERGPADKAGLIPNTEIVEFDNQQFPTGGDIIISVNNQPVEGMADLLVYLTSKTQPGDNITLGLVRGNGSTTSIQVKLEDRPGLDIPKT